MGGRGKGERKGVGGRRGIWMRRRRKEGREDEGVEECVFNGSRYTTQHYTM